MLDYEIVLEKLSCDPFIRVSCPPLKSNSLISILKKKTLKKIASSSRAERKAISLFPHSKSKWLRFFSIFFCAFCEVFFINRQRQWQWLFCVHFDQTRRDLYFVSQIKNGNVFFLLVFCSYLVFIGFGWGFAFLFILLNVVYERCRADGHFYVSNLTDQPPPIKT